MNVVIISLKKNSQLAIYVKIAQMIVLYVQLQIYVQNVFQNIYNLINVNQVVHKIIIKMIILKYVNNAKLNVDYVQAKIYV